MSEVKKHTLTYAKDFSLYSKKAVLLTANSAVVKEGYHSRLRIALFHYHHCSSIT